MYSTKFSVSIHIISMIALSEGKPVTSDYIASSVNTNPSLVRRLMGSLKDADLITTKTKVGATGLGKPCSEISLLEIFRAVEKQQTLFAIHEDTNQKCPVGRKIGHVLDNVNQRTQSKMEAELASIYLSDLLDDLR